nr:RNA-directed DNA polymerase, eukaryota [Tanacetum cinerariifolium]
LVAKGLFGIFLSNLVRRWNGEAIIMGDFNDVRTMDERLGSSFNASSARCFDRFIVSSGLVDVNLEGCSFTWSHPSASKMSKLDRFLVTEVKNFHLHNAKNSLQNDLNSIDKDLERGNVSDDILLNRMELNRRLHDIKLLEVKDLVQKSKIKWAIEGDENSKFFHGIINKKSDSLGNSSGILCIWEASIFKKDGATISDNFIAIYGTWLPRNVKILLVVVYAPQQPGSKRALWDFFI